MHMLQSITRLQAKPAMVLITCHIKIKHLKLTQVRFLICYCLFSQLNKQQSTKIFLLRLTKVLFLQILVVEIRHGLCCKKLSDVLRIARLNLDSSPAGGSIAPMRCLAMSLILREEDADCENMDYELVNRLMTA